MSSAASSSVSFSRGSAGSRPASRTISSVTEDDEMPQTPRASAATTSPWATTWPAAICRGDGQLSGSARVGATGRGRAAAHRGDRRAVLAGRGLQVGRVLRSEEARPLQRSLHTQPRPGAVHGAGPALHGRPRRRLESRGLRRIGHRRPRARDPAADLDPQRGRDLGRLAVRRHHRRIRPEGLAEGDGEGTSRGRGSGSCAAASS